MRYPHWQVGEFTTSSQVVAWRESARTKQPIHFYFYEDEFNKLDWTKEPSESWDTLCIKRCILLRQKYKKLSLFYSAGRDSHHILRIFAETGIPLDEIVLIQYPGIADRTDQLNNSIIPQVELFRKIQPNTKVKLISIDDTMYDQFFTDDWSEKSLSTSMALYLE
jgi:hypothetical protein